ncbi:hypothetical protein [Metapseudomonas sp. CR1201]
MPNVQHILTGAGSPNAAPPSVGAHYLDQDTRDLWQAVGTETAADWRLVYAEPKVLRGGGTFEVDGLRDVHWSDFGASGDVLVLAELTGRHGRFDMALLPRSSVTQFSIELQAQEPPLSVATGEEVTALEGDRPQLLTFEWIGNYGWVITRQLALPAFGVPQFPPPEM